MTLPAGFELVDESPLPAGFSLVPEGFEEIKDNVSQIPTAGYAQAPEAVSTPYVQRMGGPVAPNQLYNPGDDTARVKGLGEAAWNALTGFTGGTLGMAGGFLGGMAGAAATGHLDPQALEEVTAAGAEKLTSSPMSPAGQHYAENFGKFMNELVPVMGVAHTLPTAMGVRPLKVKGEPTIAPEAPKGRLGSLDAQMAAKKSGIPEGFEIVEPTREEQLAAVRAGQPIERVRPGTISVEPSGLAYEGTPIRSAPEVEALAKANAEKLQRQAQGLAPTGETIIAGERAPEVRSTPEVEVYAQQQALRKAEAMRREQLGLPPLESVITARQNIPEVRSSPEVELAMQRRAAQMQREAQGIPAEGQVLFGDQTGRGVAPELPGSQVRSAPEIEALFQERARAMQREAQGLIPEGETLTAGRGRGAAVTGNEPIRSTPEVEAMARERARTLQREAQGLTPEGAPMFASREGTIAQDLAAKVGSTPEEVNAVRNIQQRGLEEQAFREVFPKDEQLDVFGEPKQQPLQPLNEFRPPKGQSGRLNMAIFDDGFQKIKDIGKGIQLVFSGSEEGYPKVRALGEYRPGEGYHELGVLDMMSDNPLNLSPENNLYPNWVRSHAPGLAQEMYQFASEVGGDIRASGTQTPEGKAMWDKFRASGFAKGDVIPFKEQVANVQSIPKGQRGALDLNAVSDGIKKLISMPPNSPESQAARAQVAAIEKQNNIAKGILGVDQFRNRITTPEQVIALAPESKDISGAQKFGGKVGFIPGIRKMRIQTNNPLLHWAGTKIDNAFQARDMYSREYTTGKNGIAPLWQALSKEERTEVWEAAKRGDRQQVEITRPMMEKAGFSENQILWMEKLREMDNKQFETWNLANDEVGRPRVQRREGHLPSNFGGDFKSLFYDKEGNVLGVVSENTKRAHDKAIETMKSKYPDAKVSEMSEKKMGGASARSDAFSGFNDLLEVLAKNDPKFAEIQTMIKGAVAEDTNALYGTALHELHKKGVWGAEGDKPWRDTAANADQGFKSYLNHWEDSMLSHLMMPVNTEVKALMMNPALEHMPNAKNYLTDYIKGATGSNVGDLGQAINTTLQFLPQKMGIGQTYTREAVNQFNKRMGQKTMGFFNLPHAAMQYFQLAQTALPQLVNAADKLGKNSGDVAMAIGKASTDGIKYATDMGQKALGKEMVKVDIDPFTAEMYKAAEDRGLLKFSEFEDVHQSTQGPIARGVDKAIDLSRSVPEMTTRPLAFFTFVRLLEDSKLPRNEIFDTAYNMTQDAMVDYSSRERPGMFKKLGVVGQTAGSLQTYAFNYANQMYRWNKEALTQGNYKPALTGLAVATALGGVGGLPFYKELDDLTKFVTHHFFGGQQSIKDLAMKAAPDIAPYADTMYYGPASTQTGVNVSTRLGTSKMLPEKASELVSPFLTNAGDMVSSAYNLATQPGPTSARNAAMAFAPSSVKGILENQIATDEKGYVLDKKGLKGPYARDPFDKLVRNFGLTSQKEVATKQTFREAKDLEMRQTERKSDITNKIAYNIAQYGKDYVTSPEFAKLREEYIKQRQGTPLSLVNGVRQAFMDKNLNAKQRAEGINPQDLAGIYKYMYYNK